MRTSLDSDQLKKYLLLKFDPYIQRIQNKIGKDKDFKIAGGSVSNVILNYYHPECPPIINDVDVFLGTTEVQRIVKTFKSWVSKKNRYFDSAEIYDIKQDGDIQYIYTNILQIIPSCFDLNCTMAALIYHKGSFELQYLKEFEQFLSSKEICLDGYHINVKSILRAIKKSEELKVNFDFDFHYNLLLFKQNKENPKSRIIDAELLYEKCPKLNYRLHNLFNTHSSRSELYNLHLTSQILFLNKDQKAIIHRLPGLLEVLPRFKQKFDFNLIDVKNKSDKLLDQLNELFYTQTSFVVKCFYAKIPCSELKKLIVHKDKLLIIGIYEGFDRLIPVKNQKFEWSVIESELDQEEKSILKECEILPDVFSKNCKELVSTLDLRIEGASMHHCVGGYGDRIKRKELLIFSIKTDQGRSTLAICAKSGRIRQHRSYCNGIVCGENLKIGNELSEYFMSLRRLESMD
jgi:hypothetical protein